MGKAGLFAGEVTQAAPADGAATTKAKGYQWMEYGNVYVAPTNCNEIYPIATLTPDLLVGHYDGVDWDGQLVIGTGEAKDTRVDSVKAVNDAGNYTQWAGYSAGVYSGLAQAYWPDCQWYNYVGPQLASKMVETFDLSTWNTASTGSMALTDGIAGDSNKATTLSDTGTLNAYVVYKNTFLNSYTGSSTIVTIRCIIKKNTGTSNWCKIESGTVGGGYAIAVIFNPVTGAIVLGDATTTEPSPLYEARDIGDWWEVYMERTLGTAGPTSVSIAFYPAWNDSGSQTIDKTITGSITVGCADAFSSLPISHIYGCVADPQFGSASVVDISHVYIDLANFDDTEGGFYMEWRPMFSASDISADVEILSVNGTTDLLYYDYSTGYLTATDGTNVATVPLTLVGRTKYRVGVVFGSSKLIVGVDGVWGTEAAYVGSFTTDSNFDICRNPVGVNYWRELRGYQTTYALAINEINRLMLG